jgi:endonuclease YncB( thermonuclease family)
MSRGIWKLGRCLTPLGAICIAASAVAHAADRAEGLVIEGRSYVLWGIDTPPRRQRCASGWPAGERSAQALEGFLQGKTPVCEARGRDQAGRTVAICRVDGQDIGGALVRDGMAWARLGVPHGYVVQEAQAAAERIGIHHHHCELPVAWRLKHDDAQFRRGEGSGTSPDIERETGSPH